MTCRTSVKWLKEIFDLNDEEMDVIESQFSDRVGNIAKIEDECQASQSQGKPNKKRIF